MHCFVCVKEAYLKATGEGLAGLEQIELSLSPGKPTELIRIQEGSGEKGCWSSHQMKPSQEYVAALVVEGQGYPSDNLLYYGVT